MTVEIKDMTLDKVAIGPISARVYQGADYAKGPPVVLYFHGGAFRQSGPQDCHLAKCIAQTGAIVVVPDYNGPLGGVFPQPLEVGFSIFSYLAKKRAGLGDRKSQLLIGGEESGGSVAAGVALKARDHFADELDGQVLFSPLLDPFMGTASFQMADAIGMRQRWSEGWNHYLSGGVCHPYAAPRLCSRLSGMAPALIVSAKDDPLVDEALAYAECLQRSGVMVQSHVLAAGTGWPTIYGGTVEQVPSYEDSVCRYFSEFIRDIRVQ
jgi:acetyl esterase/lipase